jgi:hypothetical protein
MTDAPTLTPKHRERVIRALEFLEQAQVRLHDAAEALSPVPGLSDEWESVRNLIALVRELWKAVGSWLLDQDKG